MTYPQDPYGQQGYGYGPPDNGQPAPYGQIPGYGYGPPGSPYGPVMGHNGLAVASMVVGIVSPLTCLLLIFPIGPVLALIFGHVSLGQMKQTGQNGRGMAIAGVVLGWAGLAIAVAYWVLILTVGIHEDQTGG
jgi:hypothetical protein